MSTQKLRIFYIVSLVILVVLAASLIFRPLETGHGYSELQREQLLQTESEWIIQFDILNHEGKRQHYTINVIANGKEHNEEVSIENGRIFSYIHHIRRDTSNNKDAQFVIYAQGKNEPIEQVTYHLK
ncbi:hypothetical protein ACFLUP_03310 [Chloroflexota bacterium]